MIWMLILYRCFFILRTTLYILLDAEASTRLHAHGLSAPSPYPYAHPDTQQQRSQMVPIAILD